MDNPLQRYLGSLLAARESHDILDGLGLGDVARRGHSRALRNVAAPLTGLQTIESDLERPYYVLKSHFEAAVYAAESTYGFVAEQITMALEKTVSSCEAKMTILAVAYSHSSDLGFLTTLRDRLYERLEGTDLPRPR